MMGRHAPKAPGRVHLPHLDGVGRSLHPDDVDDLHRLRRHRAAPRPAAAGPPRNGPGGHLLALRGPDRRAGRHREPPALSADRHHRRGDLVPDPRPRHLVLARRRLERALGDLRHVPERSGHRVADRRGRGGRGEAALRPRRPGLARRGVGRDRPRRDDRVRVGPAGHRGRQPRVHRPRDLDGARHVRRALRPKGARGGRGTRSRGSSRRRSATARPRSGVTTSSA